MRPVAVLSSLFLILAPLTGCLGDDSPDDGVEPSGVGPLPGGAVIRYLADGTMLPAPGPLAGAARTVLTGHQGAEPTMGVTSSGAVFMAAFEEVIRSTDAGLTWETVYDFKVEGAPVDPFFNGDPMLWVDPVTDTVYDVPMFPPLLCASIISSTDDGETWAERHAACPLIQPFDRQTLNTGPPGPNAPPMAGVLHDTVLYLCYNQLATTSCLVSYDGGLTWPVNVPAWKGGTEEASSSDCAGQNGHPAAAPDGTVVIPKSWFCDGLYVVVSTDNGLTWETRPGPKVGGDTLSPEVAFTPDGTMYALWQGDDHLSYLARSPDVGRTWDGPWVVSPPDVGSTMFAAMATGTDGRVAMAFLGTRDSTEYPADVEDTARWHLFIVTTDDSDAELPTFTAHQATSDGMPVQVGPIWVGGGGDPSRNLLDFIDGSMAPDGTFYVAYAEGCTKDCDGNPDATPDDSRDRQAAFAWLDGWRLI